MDDASHRNLRQPWMQPWDRSIHARLLEHLTILGAKAVVFDILFDLPTNPAADRADAYSLGKVIDEASTGFDRTRVPRGFKGREIWPPDL